VTNGGGDADCLRDELIPRTIREAAEGSPFYRQLYQDYDWRMVQRVADLALLPSVTKESVRQQGKQMLVEGKTCSHVQNTSGSTGPPVVIYRSVEEAQFIWDFFSRIESPPT
jgi:phenylacetate-coenzyme A ligase PaaK-like adenylate-forming protein